MGVVPKPPRPKPREEEGWVCTFCGSLNSDKGRVEPLSRCDNCGASRRRNQ